MKSFEFARLLLEDRLAGRVHHLHRHLVLGDAIRLDGEAGDVVADEEDVAGRSLALGAAGPSSPIVMRTLVSLSSPAWAGVHGQSGGERECGRAWVDSCRGIGKGERPSATPNDRIVAGVDGSDHADSSVVRTYGTCRSLQVAWAGDRRESGVRAADREGMMGMA